MSHSRTPRTAWSLAYVTALTFAIGCSSADKADQVVPDGSGRLLGGHIGPAISGANTGGELAGPARFVEPLLGIFERSAAMAITVEVDKHYRSPASEGYEKAVDRVLADLYGAGFGGESGYELKVISQPMGQPAWSPQSAEIRVVGSQGRGRTMSVPIAGFKKPSDVQRLLLAEGAPSCDVAGSAVFSIDEVVPGSILVTDRSVRNVEQEAVAKGAAAIVSWFQLPYCTDPTGNERQIEAIFHGSVRPGSTIPSFYVSPRIADVMRVASIKGSTFELEGRVSTRIRNLRTIVATIRGSDRPDEAVYVVSAVSGAGANDNAAGVGGILEAARGLKRLIASGQLEAPKRTIHFVFGKEGEAGGTALDEMIDTPIAGIVADMIGASYEKTGAICLLERGWDPGAVVALPPDSHTPWGAGEVVEEDIIPNGLSAILRQALVDVGQAVAEGSGVPWSTREHPWEGGSDHDTFLGRGIPAALVWHFTDYSYSTSLDRVDFVAPEELRRTAVAIVAGAMAVADARPKDLARYRESLEIERQLRIQGARSSDAPSGLAGIWRDWFDGAVLWTSALTAGQDLPDQDGLRAIDSVRD